MAFHALTLLSVIWGRPGGTVSPCLLRFLVGSWCELVDGGDRCGRKDHALPVTHLVVHHGPSVRGLGER